MVIRETNSGSAALPPSVADASVMENLGVAPQHIAHRGYPIDLRRAASVARLREKAVDDFELAAGRVVARLTDEAVVLQDDGSQPSMADIRIDYADRPSAFIEVWNDIDQNYAAMYAELIREQHQLPNVVPAVRLHRAWQVALGRTAHVGNLKDEMEELLSALEDAGETFQIVATERVLRSRAHPAVRRLCDLGVVMLGSGPSDHGEVRLLPAGTSGPLIADWETVLGWIAETLTSSRMADVRTKLAKTNAAQRHVFIGVTFTSPGEVFFALAMDEQSLPDEAPTLPPEITHLWLMNAAGGRCIAWFPDRGWFEPQQHWATP